MSGKLIITVFGLGVLVLVFGLLMATPITMVETEVRDTHFVFQDDTREIRDYLEMTVIEVTQDQGQEYVELEYRNTRTFDVETVIVDEGDNTSFALSGEDLDAELVRIEDNDQAVITTTYPSTFGWDDGPSLFMDQLGFILVTLVFVSILGIVVMVVTG